jgi:hypothetical protein
MATVEIRLDPAAIPVRLDEMRRWLDARGIKPSRFISTGSAKETVILVEFPTAGDAESFASEFSGTLVQ